MPERRQDTKEMSIEEALRRAREGIQQIRHSGQVVIKVEGGKPIFVDVLDRRRVG